MKQNSTMLTFMGDLVQTGCFDAHMLHQMMQKCSCATTVSEGIMDLKAVICGSTLSCIS